MKTPTSSRAGLPARATRPKRARGPLRGRGMPMRITVISCTALLTGAGLLLVAGCAGSAGSSGSSGSFSVSRGSPPKAAARALAGAATPRPATAGQAASGQAASDQAARLAPSGQSIIYTADMTIQVRDAGQAASRAMTYITTAGGYTADEQAQKNDPAARRPMVSLTLKVPAAGYGAALSRLSTLGRQTSLSQQSTDVTQQVADVGSRVTSAQDAIAQLRALFRRAGSVTGLLQVQQQIASDQSTLESLLAQQRALNHETTYATISLLLVGPLPERTVRHGAHHGFVSGLAAGWRGLKHATAWVLTALGTILPFAAVVVVIGALGYAGWRRISRRRARHHPATTS